MTDILLTTNDNVSCVNFSHERSSKLKATVFKLQEIQLEGDLVFIQYFGGISTGQCTRKV